MIMRAVVLTAGLLVLAGAARADPCTRIPDRGAMPADLRPGAAFAGPVVYVGDGDSLCVAVGARRGVDWVEVRIADFRAPELSEPDGRTARHALVAIAMGRRVRCVAGRRSWDRVVAVCRLDGVSIGERMRRRGVREGGR